MITLKSEVDNRKLVGASRLYGWQGCEMLRGHGLFIAKT